MRHAFFTFFFLSLFYGYGNEIDSLTNLFNQSSDSVKVILYQELILAYQDVDFSKSISIGDDAIKMAEENKNDFWKAKFYTVIGNVYHKKSDYNTAISYFEDAKEILLNYNDTGTILTIYNNLGTTYSDVGNYAKSTELLFEGLKIAEESNSENDIARIANNIGLNYYYQSEYNTALIYYNIALKIREKKEDKQGVALAYNNIGIIYYFLEDLEKVVDYFHKALSIYEELGDIRGQSLPFYNIAEIYFEQKRYEDALEYYNKSLAIDMQVGEKGSIAMSYYSIGNVYVAMNQFEKAIDKQLEAVKIAKEIEALPILKEGYLHLSNTYEKASFYKKSLEYFKLYSAIKDSIFNSEASAQIAEIKSKYENEKKQEQIELLKQERAFKDLEINRNEEKIKNQRILLFASFLGIISIFLFAIILFRQIQQKQKINILLTDKNTELDDQNKKLGYANKEIQRAAKQKEKFFANTSHELRNPLNVVIGFTNLLLKTNLNEKQKNYLNNIKRSGNNLLVVINDLLTHSKIEAGKLQLEFIDFNLNKELEKQIEFSRQKAFQKHIVLDLNIPPEIPKYVNGDPVRFSQILSNLLSNAIKFTDFNGKIQVDVRVLEITEINANIQFSVKDNGIGIASEKLREIFDSFTQANFDTTRKFGGTGLGLAIVKSLVELQGGKISADSQLNKGSVFTFNIIFNTCTSQLIEKKTVEEKDMNLKSSLKILIVEDDPINITLAKDTLTTFDSNIELDSALNGKIAIEKIQLHNYDLVVMDIQMPVMDGYQATKYIRNNLPSPKNTIPILGMSAYAMKEEVDLCFKYGMNDYITKPFSPDELFKKLKLITNKEINEEDSQLHLSTEIIKDLVDYPKSLIQIYGNKKAKIDKILETYLAEIPKRIDNLNHSFTELNIMNTRSIAHSLKTSFKLIDNSDATKICHDIELGILNKKEILSAIIEIKKLWEVQKTNLEKLIKTEKPSQNKMA
jgi:signal transduction histidine kinase/DNA-binding NarL/FixJ family response regulator/tetratricopeptide (TPR) repeat protein